MSFLNPGYLWGLLFCVPLVAVYLLKVKPKKQETNAWFLWEKVLEEKETSALFSKLRSFLSLLLMLLMIILVCVGLSEPTFSKKDNRDVFILIDQSASMQAEVNGQSSLELAKNEAHAVVNSLYTGQRASIAVVNQSVKFLTHLSSNAQGLHKLIDSIEPSQLPESPIAEEVIKQMVKPAGTGDGEATDGDKKARIVYISDGCHGYDFSALTELETVVVAENKKRSNVGIIAADIQPSIGTKAASAMVQLVNASDEPVTVELEFYSEEKQSIEELVEVKVEPGKNKPLFFDIQNAAEGAWSVRFELEDDLILDNEVSMMLHPLPVVPVSIPESANYFYQRCVEAFSKTSGSLQLAKDDDAQIQIYQGSVPESAKGGCVVIGPTGESPFWGAVGKEVEAYVSLVELPNHPMMRHIDVNHFSFIGAKELEVPEEAKVIIQSESGVPLLYQVSKPGLSVLVVNLDPQLNDFFLSTGFIVLVYDAAMYLSGNEQRPFSVLPLGQAYEAAEDQSYTVPDKVGEVSLEKGQKYFAEKVGLYKSTDESGKDFAVSLLSARESRLVSEEGRAAGSASSSGYPLSFWLVVIGFMLLVAESVCYHRRKAD